MANEQRSRRHFVKHSALAAGSLGLAGRSAAAAQKETPMLHPDLIGLPVSEVPTPALLVDLDTFEANLAMMARVCAGRKTQYRPHGKAHKSSLVAKKQLAAGAGGLCAGKLGEAEVFVAGGIRDPHHHRGCRPSQDRASREPGAASPEVKVVVDNAENVADLAAAAAAEKVRLAYWWTSTSARTAPA